MIVSYLTVLMLEVAGNIQQPPIVVKMNLILHQRHVLTTNPVLQRFA